MDELDARLRAMAKREDWALPAAYESAMDGLEEQIRQGGTLDRPGKRRLGKRVLFCWQRRRCPWIFGMSGWKMFWWDRKVPAIG